MTSDLLSELLTLSNELAALRDLPAATKQTLPENPTLHPALGEVLASGALGLTLQGVDVTQLNAFTEDAARRGMRRRAVVFGKHPKGHTLFATPQHYGDDAVVFQINRLERLATTTLTLDDFLKLCIEHIQAALEEAKMAPPEPEPTKTFQPSHVPVEKVMRQARVVLPETEGAVVLANGRSEEFESADFAYIIWCMTALQMTNKMTAPDLSRWHARCLRACRLDETPAEGHADHARYLENWDRLTHRDRSAPGPISYKIPSFKINASGTWVLAPNETAVLKRSEQAKPPRHTPSAEQSALWARWMSIVTAGEAVLHIR